MDIQHLVHMANQIGQFFSAYPDRDEAMQSIATHLKKFWPPTMRQAMLEALATPQTSDLMPLVHEALTRHASDLRPLAAPRSA